MNVGEWLAIAMFASFILLIFSGFPIAWVLGGLAVLFSAIAIITDADFGTRMGLDWQYSSLTIERTWNVMENWTLVALPMFVFMGIMLDRSGIAVKLMTDLMRAFGRMRGGLAVAVTLIGLMLAASTGIIGASVVLLALIGLPAMTNARYDMSLATGTICAVGTLGILIPPSIMLVLMADRLALPVGDLFLGALFPGLLLGVMYLAYIVIYAQLRPDAAPAPDHAERFDLRAAFSVLTSTLAPAGLILAVLGSIFFGLATPTEASGVGALGALLLALGNRKLTLGVLTDVLRDTTRTTGFIFAIFLGATAYSLVLRGLGGDELMADLLLGLPLSPIGIVVVILAFTFLLGFFLDWIEITLIVLPLVAPVVQALGFDLVWFTVLFAVCLQTSFLTPPVGFSIFYLKGAVPNSIDTRVIYKGVMPFVLLQILGMIAVFYFESLVTWLPAQAYQ